MVFDGKGYKLEPLMAFLEKNGLKASSLPNPGRVPALEPLKAALPGAIDAMKAHVITQQGDFNSDMQERLASHLSNLKELQGRQVAQLELRLSQSGQAEGAKSSVRERKTTQIAKVFDEYRQWVEDTLTIEPSPFIEVLAVVTRP